MSNLLTIAPGETSIPLIVSRLRQLIQYVQSLLGDVRLAISAAYTVQNSDKGATIALGGSAFYTLTFNAASTYDPSFQVVVLNEDSVRAKNISLNGVTFFLYPGQSIEVFSQNNVWQTLGGGRWRLTGNVTVYANQSTGSDTNSSDGLASGAAKATITVAFEQISTDFDLNGHSVTVLMGANETSSGLHIGLANFFVGMGSGGGGGTITLDGGGFTLSGGSQPALYLFFAYSFTVQNITLTSTGDSGISLDHAMVRVGSSVTIGACAADGIRSRYGSKAEIDSGISISGNIAGAIFHAGANSSIIIPVMVTVTASITVGYTLLAEDEGIIDLRSGSFSIGANVVTGVRFIAQNGGNIQTGSSGNLSLAPGTTAGSLSNGLYDQFNYITYSYTPTDQSGAGLTFTGVNVQYFTLGNMVTYYGQFTYPVTASAANALFSTPVAIPNHTYAGTASSVLTNVATATDLAAIRNSSELQIVGPGGATAVHNSVLSGTQINFLITYPAT